MPIGLGILDPFLTSIYKSFDLANHLRKVLPLTIFESQGAFMAKRQIFDQALTANEAIENYRAKKKEGVIFKIDFGKAYDNVD